MWDSDLEAVHVALRAAGAGLETTGRLACESGSDVRPIHCDNSYRQTIIYWFYGSIPKSKRWINVVLRAGKLVGSHYPSVEYHGHNDFGWIYKAMEFVSVDFQDDWDNNIIAGVSGLLNALLYYGSPPLKQHIHLVLRALSTPGDISHDAARLLVQDNILQWFQDNETKSILQTACVWSSLVSPRNPSHGHSLANIRSWMAQIKEELCSWPHSHHWIIISKHSTHGLEVSAGCDTEWKRKKKPVSLHMAQPQIERESLYIVYKVISGVVRVKWWWFQGEKWEIQEGRKEGRKYYCQGPNEEQADVSRESIEDGQVEPAIPELWHLTGFRLKGQEALSAD
ncbi:hypothetical protein B0H13DRAFT_1910383 [Mycena leptocephala]|nr:hypothetical protein B0H13DRAFT_1910383 [Mycena leptocephala]